MCARSPPWLTTLAAHVRDEHRPVAGSPPPRARSAAVGLSAFFPCYNDAPTIATMVRGVHDRARASWSTTSRSSWSTTARPTTRAEVLAAPGRGAARSCGSIDPRRATGATAGRSSAGFGAATKRVGLLHRRRRAVRPHRGRARWSPRSTPATSTSCRAGRSAAATRWHRGVIGRVYHHVVRLLFGLPVRDTDCDFRLFRATLLERADAALDQRRDLRRDDARGSRTPAPASSRCPVHHYRAAPRPVAVLPHPAHRPTARQLLALWWREVVRGRKGS